MAYYDLTKPERQALFAEMKSTILSAFQTNNTLNLLHYMDDSDTYIRKNAYLIIGNQYFV